MPKRKSNDPDSDDPEELSEGDGQYIVSWGIEIVTTKPREKSQMFSVRRIVLGCDSIFVELADGKEMSFQADQVKKVLAMRSTLPTSDDGAG